MSDALLQQLASSGVMGLLLALALVALWEKDKQLKAEMTARITDATRYTDLALGLQKELIDAARDIKTMLDLFQKFWNQFGGEPIDPRPRPHPYPPKPR